MEKILQSARDNLNANIQNIGMVTPFGKSKRISMTTILQKLLDGALDAARVLTISSILRRLGVLLVPSGSPQTCYMDEYNIGLLSSDSGNHERIDRRKPSPESSQHYNENNGEREEVEATKDLPTEPTFTLGEPSVMIAQDQDRIPCYTTTVTRQLLSVFNDAAEAHANQKYQQTLLRTYEDKQESMLDSVGEQFDLENESQYPEDADGAGQFYELRDKMRLCNQKIQDHERYFNSCKAEIHELIEAALESAGLLKQVQVDVGDDIIQDNAGEVPTSDNSEPKNFELSEAERSRRRGRQEFIEAKEQLFLAQMHFDKMEVYEREDLAKYKNALAEGTAEISRSERDVNALICNMNLTRDLIEAEQAFNEAKEEAERVGAFADEWGRLSMSDWDCGMEPESERKLPSGLDPDQVDPYDFEEPIGEEDIVRVEAWMDRVDDEANPDLMPNPEEIHADEWQYREPELFESLSMVDFDSYGKQIGLWQSMCEEQRQQWRETYPSGSPKEKYGHALKRRMSF